MEFIYSVGATINQAADIWCIWIATSTTIWIPTKMDTKTGFSLRIASQVYIPRRVNSRGRVPASVLTAVPAAVRIVVLHYRWVLLNHLLIIRLHACLFNCPDFSFYWPTTRSWYCMFSHNASRFYSCLPFRQKQNYVLLLIVCYALRT